MLAVHAEHALGRGDVLQAKVEHALLALQFGPGVRLGYTHLEGKANDSSLAEHSVAGRWWGPCLNASTLLRLSGPWSLRAALDATYLARGLRATEASGATLYRLQDVLLSASLGLSLSLL